MDLLLDLSDREVLDIFARLNTYSVSLNKQELFNAKYFGYFKQLVYQLRATTTLSGLENKIFTERKIVRMAEAELVTDLLIAILEGIQSKKVLISTIKNMMRPLTVEKIVEGNFKATMDLIGTLFGETLEGTEFRTVPNFYALFVALYHLNYGIPGLNSERKPIAEKDYPKIFGLFGQY